MRVRRRAPSTQHGIERCRGGLGRRRQERRQRTFKQRQSEVRGAGLPVLAMGGAIAAAVVVRVVAVIVIRVVVVGFAGDGVVVVVVVVVGVSGVVVGKRVAFGTVGVVVTVRGQVGHGHHLRGQQEHAGQHGAGRGS